jgi:hypothetical protein
MAQLITAFPALAFCCQQPVHRAQGAVVWTFIEQGGVHLRGRAILKTLFMQTGQHRRLLFFPETAGGSMWPAQTGRTQTTLTLPVIKRAANRQLVAGTLDSYARAQVLDRPHQQFSFSGIRDSGLPSSIATFFGFQ